MYFPFICWTKGKGFRISFHIFGQIKVSLLIGAGILFAYFFFTNFLGKKIQNFLTRLSGELTRFTAIFFFLNLTGTLDLYLLANEGF